MLIFSPLEWIVLLLAGLFTGFAKTGISTMGIFNVMLMTQIFPAKQAVGTLLPMLIAADMMAVAYYRRHVVWKHLFSLAPWVLVGIAAGYAVLWAFDDRQLQWMLGMLIGILIALQLVKDRFNTRLDAVLPRSRWFNAVMGGLAGFATTVGNVSGVIMAMYLFSKNLPKQEIVGTGAWFFLFVNVIKVPFFLQLGMITGSSFLLNVYLIPLIALGAWIGVKLVPVIPQTWFHRIILLLGAVGAVRLMMI